MKDKHTDYFLRKITVDDENRSFQSIREEFNTLSETLKEYVILYKILNIILQNLNGEYYG